MVHSMGNIYSIVEDGKKSNFILSGWGKMMVENVFLVSLNTGRCWQPPVVVNDWNNLTDSEWDEITDGEDFKPEIISL